MSNKEIVTQLLKKHNGFISSSEAASSGVDNKTLQRMWQSGEIEKIGHGLYMDPNLMEDEYFLTQYRCKKGIFSHETALYFHDLADRTPFQLMLTIPSGYNTRLLKDREKYKFFYVASKRHSIGEMTMATPFGNRIQVYNKERTVIDCLKKKDQLDGDIVTGAVKQYFSTPGSDFAKLLKYAEIFNIRDSIRKYMEVMT